MAVKIGSARIDERGRISGGKPGDQTGSEVATQNWYLHAKGWVVIRAKDDAVREKIARAMEASCANNKIGYDQTNRNGLYNAVKNKGFDPAKCDVLTETDCSADVRVCVHYAGITCPDFNTASEVAVLSGTGRFNILRDAKYTKSSDYLLRGDILVTATKGHTVVVLTNGPKAGGNTPSPSPTPSNKPAVAKPTIKRGSRGENAKLLQKDLNYVINAGLATDGIIGDKSVAAIKSFQRKYGLSVDGIYGNKSYNKMKSLLQ
jgi:hypothetical protein